MKHAILPCLGTDGDVYPFIELGIELRKRGYDVTIATHEHFAEYVAKCGLEFCTFVSNTQTHALLQQRDFWHPFKGPIVVARWGAKMVESQFRLLSKVAAKDGAFLIANPGVVSARIVQEALGIPLVSIVLQPWMIPSIYAPPTMMGGLTLPQWAPKPVGRLYISLFNRVGALLVGQDVTRVRRSLGLKSLGRIFDWWYSPELVIGLFPEWYGKPQIDWPNHFHLVGFPGSAGRSGSGISQDTLAFCNQGDPPFVFTFGTGMMHAKELFELGINACRMLGRRGILLTKHEDQLPADLPAFIHHSRFEPFHELFPHCAAVVHHGGVGTVAKALAAGVPQLILPFAFDQLDNAVRVARLNAGRYCNRGARAPNALARQLHEVISGPCVAGANQIKSRFEHPGGVERAASLIEDLLNRGPGTIGN